MPTHLSIFPGDRNKTTSYSPNISKQKHWLEYDYNCDNNSKETTTESNQRNFREEDDAMAMRSLRRIHETSLGLNKAGLTYSEASRDRKLALIQTLSPAPVRQSTKNREISVEKYLHDPSEETLRITSAPTPTWARKTRRVVSGSYEAGKEEFRKDGKSTFHEAVKERYAQRQRLQGDMGGMSFGIGDVDTSSWTDHRPGTATASHLDASPQLDWAHGHGQPANRKHSLSPAEVISDAHYAL
jgi:hypothetical protein